MARFIEIENFVFDEKLMKDFNFDDEDNEEKSIIIKSKTIINLDHVIRIDESARFYDYTFRGDNYFEYYTLTLTSVDSTLGRDHRTYLETVFSDKLNITKEEFNKWFKDLIETK